MRLISALRGLERRTRPVDPEYADILRRRWAALPEHVKTPGQFLGRHAVGCEGTHGVFPKCNLACTPCYHSRDANRVRIDGAHTIAEVDKQMALLRRLRGPRAHAQLIGGEVTLLDPDDHAETLLTMRRYGREPMSMSHGDFDYEYLEKLALDQEGKPRLKRISFAGHFDMMMFGRRGIPRASSERELNPYRQRFVDMFARLRAQHGVRSFLAHNMTVTPANLGQVADLVRDCHTMGFGMFSFQPAAFVGDNRRWHENYEQVGMEEVWAEIEKGVGTPLDYTAIQHGDLRCNRAAYGFFVGPRWCAFLTGDDPGDVAAREAFFRYFGEVNFAGVELPDLIGKVTRVIARHPIVAVIALRWLIRLVRRAGGPRALWRHGVRPVSFVIHQFMDAADVAPAWELMKRGEKASDPRILAAQERLAACHYAMAHPRPAGASQGTPAGELVPACVQHCVLDPVENIELRRLLPIVDAR